ncbi:MAG: hypothetical protein AAF726_09335 [Planctomycetota bacterium]
MTTSIGPFTGIGRTLQWTSGAISTTGGDLISDTTDGIACTFTVSVGPQTLGTPYCMTEVNSTGVRAVLSATGASAASANDVTLETSDLPANAFGDFPTSQVQGFIPNPAGSEGHLCLGGAIGRYVRPGQIVNSGAAGAFSLTLDLTQQPTPMGFVSVAAGET